MKVSIIGGGGLVGSCAAFALQAAGVARQIALVDANADLAAGVALDLLHGSAAAAGQEICSGSYEQIPDSDVLCITAGLRRKPEESRLDLINRNVALFLSILDRIGQAGCRKDAVLLVVSNPVDILTYLAATRLGLPPGQVLGLGTLLDSIRFRSLIARRLAVPPTQVSALILGEHGDSMVPIWSGASLAGLALDKTPGWTPKAAAEVFEETKGAGAKVIQLKGGAGFAVGLAIREVISALALDRRCLLPVSTVHHGPYGIRDVALSLPTLVGRPGALGVHTPDLWPKELQGLRTSAHLLRQTLDTVLTA
jgi:L-lactate dehydrogenase